MEEWKTIEDYPNYMISNHGRVKSFKRKKEIIMKTPHSNGHYKQVQLYKNKIGKTFCIHTLVWDAFGNAQRDGHNLVVDHIDENKLNNHIDNLQLKTNEDNIIKSVEIKGRKINDIKEYQKEYRAKNIDKIKKYRKEYYHNKNKIKN